MGEVDKDMVDTVLLIATALCSGLVATLVTLWFQKKEKAKATKLHIFTTLMSRRYDLVDEECVAAFNMIDVAFYKSDRVRKAWKEFFNAVNGPDSPTKAQIIRDRNLKLLEVMAEDIGYKDIKWDDIKNYYYPVGLSERKQMEESLRRINIEAGLAQIKSLGKTSSAQISDKDQLNAELIKEAMRNPDSLIKLMDAVEKAQKLKTNAGNKSGG